MEEPNFEAWRIQLSKARVPFLLPKAAKATDHKKGDRSAGPTGYRWGLKAGKRTHWETTSDVDTWYTDEGLWRTLHQLWHGIIVHCRRCDYINHMPDGSGDCSAYTVVKDEESLGVWCWGSQTIYWFDKTLARIMGTGSPEATGERKQAKTPPPPTEGAPLEAPSSIDRVTSLRAGV